MSETLARLTEYLMTRVDFCLHGVQSQYEEAYEGDGQETWLQACALELERIATPFLLSVVVELLGRRGRVDASGLQNQKPIGA